MAKKAGKDSEGKTPYLCISGEAVITVTDFIGPNSTAEMARNALTQLQQMGLIETNADFQNVSIFEPIKIRVNKPLADLSNKKR